MKQVWDTLWGFVHAHASLTLTLSALVVSVYAAVISHVNVRVSRRSAAGTISQAESAEKSAVAALDQAREAQMIAALSRDASEVQALEAARSRIDLAAAQVVVTVDLLSDRPSTTSRSLNEIILPHPEIHSNNPTELTYMEHRNDYLYFVLHGTLYNDGEHVVRIRMSSPGYGATFYPGSHPVSAEEIPIPQWSRAEDCYFLYPRQTALFEIRAAKNIWDILHHYEDSSSEAYYTMSRDSFTFQSGSYDDPVASVIIITRVDEPLGDRSDGPWDAPLIIKDRCTVAVEVERKRHYPKSFAEIHAELQDDDKKLERLRRNDMLMAAYLEQDTDSTSK